MRENFTGKKLVILTAAWAGVAVLPPDALTASEIPPILPTRGEAVAIDGVIAEGEWKDALPLGRIKAEGDEDFPTTEAWVRLDGDRLLVAVRCEEPYPKKIKTTTLADEIKGTVWLDDSVEVILDPGNTGRYLWHVIANTEGTIYDGIKANGQAVADAWHSGATVRTRIGNKSWEAELSIPLEGIGHPFVRGEVIGLNIARVRYAGGKRQVASYAGKQLHEAKGFPRLLIGGPIAAGGGELIIPHRGPFRIGEEGSWEFQKVAGDWKEMAVKLRFPNDDGKARPLTPDEAEADRVSIPFPATQVDQYQTAELMTGGKTIYRSTHEVREVERAQRFTKVSDPLFDELIEKRPEGLSKEGILNWMQELQRPLMKVVPYRAGMLYRHQVTPFENYARDRSILIASPTYIKDNPDRVKTAEAYGIGWILQPHYYAALRAGVPSFDPKGSRSEKHIWILDPRAKAAFLDGCRQSIELAAENKDVRWLFAGDEAWERLHRALLLALDRKEEYPELMAADREIREKYGFGKFGLPLSSTDDNPFRWIATYRWEIDQMMAVAKEVRKMIDEKAPQMRLVSWDSMTGHRPYAIDHWGEVFDIATAQIYPAAGNRDHIGFTTQFYADLSNVDEIWPVPHFEHFPNNFTAEETRAILSAMLRGGATGMHLWTGDYINESVHRRATSIVDRIGAPERWHEVRAVIDRMKEPFRVRQPEADTAIFYSNPSFQATGAPPTFQQNNHCEWIYTVLGLKLQGAIRLIDELKVARDPALLKRFRVVYLPYVPIADNPEYEALEAYVRGGGMLVICDPQAFRYRTDGTERTGGELRPPVSEIAEKPEGGIFHEPEDGEKRRLPALGEAYPFRKLKGAILLRDGRGTPIALEQKLGEGRMIFMAMNPAVQRLIADKPWTEFFRMLQQKAGAKLGNDVWRFQLPAPPPAESDRPAGLCLTDNYFEWSYSRPKPMANARAGGSYQVEGHVDLFGRETVGEEISFENGRLTDRIHGALAPNEARRSAYTLLCSAKKPWSIRFHFGKIADQRLVRIFYGGKLPAGYCEVSSDGENWQRAGEWEASEEAVDDVGMTAVPLSEGNATRFLKLHFQASGGRSLELAEIDVWADQIHDAGMEE